MKSLPAVISPKKDFTNGVFPYHDDDDDDVDVDVDDNADDDDDNDNGRN